MPNPLPPPDPQPEAEPFQLIDGKKQDAAIHAGIQNKSGDIESDIVAVQQAQASGMDLSTALKLYAGPETVHELVDRSLKANSSPGL